jgi:integral membrane protein
MNLFNYTRYTALVEGYSYLILLFVAMPVKYLLSEPILVKIVGMAHGVLFILLAVLLGLCMIYLKWSFKKSVTIFLLSLIPFGTLWYDKKIEQE